MIHLEPEWLTKDDHGIQMPWYVRPYLEILDKIDLAGKHIFEYGCGNSTRWYRSREAEVDGVDSNKYWAAIAGIIMLTTDSHEYIKAIQLSDIYYDIVCIDGIYRDECFPYALSRLKRDGFVIIDNWKQASCGYEKWPITEGLIEKCQMKIEVYKEPLHEDWKTAVIFR